MTTPLLMLAIMVAPMLLARLRATAAGRPIDTRSSAAIGLGLLFSFTASGHFFQAEEMALMLPSWVPGRIGLVYTTGLLEVVIALAFFEPALRRQAGWLALVVLVGFFPANIHAAIERVPVGGHAWGPVYLWLRAPVQIAIVAWVYGFTVRPPRHTPPAGLAAVH